MRKITFLLIALAMSAFYQLTAQTWDAPSYKSEVPVTGTAYYIYNIATNGFLNRGGDWGAEAIVSSKPIQNASANINKWTSVNTSGSTWTFQYNNNGSNIANNFLFQINDGAGWIFTDNSTNNTWDIAETDAVNHIYSIQVTSTAGHYNASVFLGAQATSRTSNRGICNSVRYNETPSDYTKWKFISQANYELYLAKANLDRYMTYAKAKGGIDLTSYISTYNADITADIITASTNLLAILAPTDVTSSITNSSFESSFTGWTNSGFATQTNNPPFTKDGTTYAEKWVGGPSNLPAATITQNVAVPNGVYQLVVTGHAFQQSGSNPLHTYALAVCGSKTTELSSAGGYIVDNVEVTNGSLTIGYKLDGAIACNWTGFDNFKLYRYITYATPALGASVSTLVMDDIIPSTSFTVSGANLTAPVVITAPSGIVVNPTQLATNPSNELVSVTYDGTSTVNGNITLTSGSTTATVRVKASSNTSCYTPLYPSGNMIADPTFTNSISSFANGGYAGWGPKGINTKTPYCGAATGYILGSCWPNGGSMDRALTTANGNALKPNTKYRLRAMINSQASTGSFQFQIEGYDGSASLYYQIPNTSGWVQFDETFTTGATVTEKGIYFNSCTTPPAVTDTCFIDNYELYEIPAGTGLNDLNKNSVSVYFKDNNIVSEFELNQQSAITVSVLDLQGKVLVKSTETAVAGRNKMEISNKFPAGIYLVKLNCNEFTSTKKLIIR